MELKQQTSNEYGISQELLVLSELVNYGIVSVPYGNSARYDCILDIQGDIFKIQIKSLNLVDNKIIVPMCNSRMSSEGTVHKVYTTDEVDFIAVYFNNQVYLFPTGLAKGSLTLSIDKPKKQNQRYIEDFVIYKVLDIDLKTWTKLKEETRKQEQENKNQYFCPDCGAPVSEEGRRCITCARIFSRKVERPSREELKNLIRNKPFTQIGKDFDVTDNAVRKWCKVYNLPSQKKIINKYSEEEWKGI